MTQQPPSQAEAEASVWLARLHADDRKARDETAFHDWIAADPAHEQAFARLTAAWDLAGSVARAPYLPEPAGTQVMTAGMTAGMRLNRRGLIGGTVAVAALAGGLGYWQTAVAGVYEAAPGQRKLVTLSDGSHLMLDTDTRVRERFTKTTRSLELVRGRCNIRIVPDSHRPFEVEMAAGKVMTGQGDIDVLNDVNRVQVLCIKGNAFVTQAGSIGQLSAGQRYVSVANQAARIDQPDMGSQTAWQTGQAVFDDEPLAQAILDMNRYSQTKLVMGDEHAAGLRISGAYLVGDNARFALSVSRLLPIALARDGDRIVITSKPGE